MNPTITIIQGDAIENLRGFADGSVHCCVTSPPYWGLRDYGVSGQLGLEKTPEEYVAKMVEVFREVRRVLRDDGTLWLNLGDSYAGGGGFFANAPSNLAGSKQSTNRGSKHQARTPPDGLKPKDLCGIPWRVAFALQSDGWWLRQDIIWHKPNPMPESVTDRCTKAHEYIFLLSKSDRYYFDSEAIKEPHADTEYTRERYKYAPSKGHKIDDNDGNNHSGEDFSHHFGLNGRNKRSVWTVPSSPYSEAHFATFPPDLIKPCILAGTSAKGCCPKCGAPWERVMEANGRIQSGGTTERTKALGIGHGNGGNSMLLDGSVTQYKTVGWQPDCECGETDTQPCTVLDPFGGSGTTGMVALELGRKFVLIELNPAYVKLAEHRTNVTPGLQLA